MAAGSAITPLAGRVSVGYYKTVGSARPGAPVARKSNWHPQKKAFTAFWEFT